MRCSSKGLIAYLGFITPAKAFHLTSRQAAHHHSIHSRHSMMSNAPLVTLPKISKRIEKTLDPCVVLMKEMIGSYSAEWQDRGGIYSLAQGVVYWKPPPTAQSALLEAVQQSSEPESTLHMYGPDEGLPELRQVLQEKIQTENLLNNHHVMVTVGANQAYMNCVLTLLESNNKAVVFKPYYFNHVMALQMVLSDADEQLLVGPSSENGIPDLAWLEAQLQADPFIKVVTMTNPCNPTGVLLERSVVQQAVDLCRKQDVWLVLDCTYEYFVSDSFDGCFSDAHVIHIFSLSKAYALAGYRCGYMVMSKSADPLYQQVMKVQGE
ncbi:hypothetical protein MPSEU_000139400 [Mayamaea pseudoterrestris]|nr:hypothetical protein MPSEU_000139400 [Mayamaea pseudoterrestris]